ncbi:unnamed protein product [Rhizophagus irregularis]|uniref:CCHC-type domain-containing protein n=1 Tax=Rhizophagus irregularis TaxID=588596 RepID=A0A916A092_9GLOM|nr:unnamed protein product [Rhizophagus irregularis]CAB5216817.1 unnamed protein product [Rhizophagus irregularis]CAB5394657.1 unnamed protein product [Rhizophagus irregularis]
MNVNERAYTDATDSTGDTDGSSNLLAAAGIFAMKYVVLNSCYLCLFDQNNNDYCEERLTVLEQRIVYVKLHGVYKKALNKALQTTSKLEQLISLLQEFADDKNDDDETDSEEFYQYDDTSDKENFDPSIPLLQNPKKWRGKGRPLGTKRFKSTCEISSSKTKTQRRCKKCGKVGHYQKNCKEQ